MSASRLHYVVSGIYHDIILSLYSHILTSNRVTRTGFALASEASHHRTHFQMLVEDDEGRELFFDVPQAQTADNSMCMIRVCSAILVYGSKCGFLGMSWLLSNTESSCDLRHRDRAVLRSDERTWGKDNVLMA